MPLAKLEGFLVRQTVSLLRRRKWRKLVRQSRRQGWAVVFDWIFSIIAIIIAVILINMFVFQNYRIPSRSMEPTLLVDDLIFVEKISFGPEILPGKLKLPSGRPPGRGEVVSFESEDYARAGPIVELAYRFVYFITLSLVNLKTDRNNKPIVDLLIKRVIGLAGERVREYRGKTEILPDCESVWREERELLAEAGAGDPTIAGRHRSPAADPVYNAYDEEREAYERSPEDAAARAAWMKRKLGWYVPLGTFFPLGDNRDDSYDARFRGPIPLERIQGKAVFRFFPFTRFGFIR